MDTSDLPDTWSVEALQLLEPWLYEIFTTANTKSSVII